MESGRRPQSILFCCTFNAVRSPMAEAIARYYYGREVYFASAGVKAGELDPFAVAAMDDIGIDIHKFKPHTFEDLEDSSFDLIVTLSPEAHHKALELILKLLVEVVYRATVDQTSMQASGEQMLDAYRSVRDGLVQRIKITLAK